MVKTEFSSFGKMSQIGSNLLPPKVLTSCTTGLAEVAVLPLTDEDMDKLAVNMVQENRVSTFSRVRTKTVKACFIFCHLFDLNTLMF